MWKGPPGRSPTRSISSLPTDVRRKRRYGGSNDMADSFRIRPVTATDLPAVAAIERAVFPDPWSQRAFRDLVGEIAMVAHQGPEIIGYLFGRVAADEAEVLNIAVSESHRRK